MQCQVKSVKHKLKLPLPSRLAIPVHLAGILQFCVDGKTSETYLALLQILGFSLVCYLMFVM